MNLKFDPDVITKNLLFWHNKPDEECIELATDEVGVDSEKALMNMLERDFCTEFNNTFIDMLKNMANTETVYPRIQIESILKDRNIRYIQAYSDQNERVFVLLNSSLAVSVQLEYYDDTTASFYIRVPDRHNDLMFSVWHQSIDEPNGITFEDAFDEFLEEVKKYTTFFSKVKMKLDEIKAIFDSYGFDENEFNFPSDFQNI